MVSGADSVRDAGFPGGSETAEFWFVMVVLAAIALYLLREAARRFWQLRTITDTPTAKIQSAPQGYVELSGLVVEGDGSVPIPAPLTDRPCVWYRYRIEKKQGSGRRSNEWTTVEKGTFDRPFLLDDGTGRCLVDPGGAQLKLHRTDRWLGPNRNPRHHQVHFAWLGGDERFRFTEERIQVGDPIYLLGRFHTPRRGSAEREQLQRELLRLWKRDPDRMRQLDRDGDGEIGEADWELARQEAERLAAKTEDRIALMPVMSRVVDTGDASSPYIISTYPVEDLVVGLRWRTLGLTFGFLAIVASAGFALIQRFGSG